MTASYRDRARTTAQRQKELAKHELGRRAFETLENYFPEEAKARRRRSGMTLFLVGLAAGILLRHAVDR